jgi:hypothetical protein
MEGNVIEKENEDLFRRLESADDQSCAILAASRIDMLLYNAIKRTLLPPLKPNDEDPVLDQSLQSFSSRINAAYRLGLIAPQFVNSLNLLRRIRNEFSHELIHLTFDCERQKGRVMEFSKYWNYGVLAGSYDCQPAPGSSKERHYFIVTCKYFITLFTPLLEVTSQVKTIGYVKDLTEKLNGEFK